MQKNSQDFSMQEVMRLAKSPAGQQLLAMLQSTDSNKMQQAADLARAHAQPGDVVTMSPACASIDRYPNFMVHGKAFKAIVNGWQ